jgi:hypothetical protein
MGGEKGEGKGRGGKEGGRVLTCCETETTPNLQLTNQVNKASAQAHKEKHTGTSNFFGGKEEGRCTQTQRKKDAEAEKKTQLNSNWKRKEKQLRKTIKTYALFFCGILLIFVRGETRRHR